MIYQFRNGSRFSVKPQAAGEELERIRVSAGGGLTPSAVVEESRPEEAILHREFEWDDEAAAEKYREDQARNLIRSVQVVLVNGDKEEAAQQYVHVVRVDHGPAYQPTRVVMADDDLRAQAIDNALALLRGVQRRYEHLGELRGLFAAIDRAAAALKAKKPVPAKARKPSAVRANA